MFFDPRPVVKVRDNGRGCSPPSVWETLGVLFDFNPVESAKCPKRRFTIKMLIETNSKFNFDSIKKNLFLNIKRDKNKK